MQLFTDDGQHTGMMLTTHVRKALQVIEAVGAGHTQHRPAFGSDGIDPDNPDLFGGYAYHCSRLDPRIYAREAPSDLCTASGVCSLHGEKDCPSLLGGRRRRRHGLQCWARGNTIHLNFHYFFAGILVPFMKKL